MVVSDASLREEIYDQILQPVIGLMEQYLQSQVEAGNFRQINPAVITRALIGSLVLNATSKLSAIDKQYEEISADQIIEEIVSLFLKGVAVEAS